MELTYKQLEAALFAHFRIHPDQQPRFRSRIKQLQRLKSDANPTGFPNGVQVGRGVKMVYNASHLFQLVTAFELIGAQLPAERATTIVSRHWPAFAVGYSLAVQGIKRWRFDLPMYAWILSRSFGELQTEPYAVPRHPLSAYPDSARVVIADSEGLSQQLLSQINRRRAHAYTLLPLTDLTTHVLTALEGAGGCTAARCDPEFNDWLPPEDMERDGWLFISFNAWEALPQPYYQDNMSTEEIIQAHITHERVMKALERQREIMEAAPEPFETPPALRKAAEALAEELSTPAAILLAYGPSDDAEADRDSLAELFALQLLSPAPNGEIHIMPLGQAVYEIVRPKDDENVVEGEDTQVTPTPAAMTESEPELAPQRRARTK